MERYVSKQTKFRFNFFLLVVIVTCGFLLSSCGGGNSSPSGSTSDTGKLYFSVVYHDTSVNLQSKAAVINCASEGISTVEAKVYDPDDGLLQSGGPWDCGAGRGTIASVPAGKGRIVVILGKDSEEDVVFRGEKSGINILAGNDNNVGTIDCYAFIPNLKDPADGAEVNADAAELTWNAVAGAIEYRVIVSENRELSDHLIDVKTTQAIFLPEGLSSDTTYYWQVVASDSYDNSGIGSQIWSFRVGADHGNTPPVVQIYSPGEGSTYTAADTITFSGSGSDSEDGNLTGTSLEWNSNIDGLIGNSETCTSITLVAGVHQITLTGTDSDGATGTDQIVITIPAGRLPDTGQDSGDPYIIGEDSDYDINPPSYTKMDALGNALDKFAADWAMVRDNVTGLIWEVKTDDDGIHDPDDVYTWNDIQEEFIAPLNNSNFGGHSDWRLPTIQELFTIVHNIKVYGDPKTDITYFPNTTLTRCWSSSISTGNSDYAWFVNFGIGYNHWDYRPSSNYVRAVRGAQPVTNIVNNNDGTVTDKVTALMWQLVESDAATMNWKAALDYCENLILAGYDDWRLPNSKELQSIVDYKAYDPAIDETSFQNTKSDSYWSSTTFLDKTTENAWGVNFISGRIHTGDKSESYYVRAVRGGQ